MDLKALGEKLLKVAPQAIDLAASFVPGGPLVTTGLKVLSSFLGTTPDPEAISTALDDPKASDAVRLAMIQFNTEKMKAEYQEKENARNDVLEEFKTSLADIQNARQADVSKTQTTGKRDTNLYVLAWVLVLGFFALLGILLWRPVPQDSSGVIFLLFGTLASSFGAVVGFFFGSSRGSQAKDELLLKATPPVGK